MERIVFCFSKNFIFTKTNTAFLSESIKVIKLQHGK